MGLSANFLADFAFYSNFTQDLDSGETHEPIQNHPLIITRFIARTGARG